MGTETERIMGLTPEEAEAELDSLLVYGQEAPRKESE